MTLALLITAVGGAWAGDLSETITTATSGTTTYNGEHFTITGSKCDSDGFYLSKANSWTATITSKNGEVITMIEMTYTWSSGQAASTTATAGTMSADGKSVTNVKASTVTISTTADTQYAIQIDTWKIYYTAPAEPDVKVDISDDQTSATMEMPTSDVAVEYELVRDMSVQMTAQVGDGTQEQPRYRVKKDGNNKFIPADMEMTAVPALFTVNDAIEQKALTQTQDYIVQIYAIDAEGQPTGDPMTFATFTFEPGIYAVKAVAATGSDYAGETALSNTFQLFQGYEIDVPLTEYATAYYENENLRLEGDDADYAKLYIIKDVDAAAGTASVEAVEVVPAGVPFIVYNESGSTDPSFLLIPVDAAAAVEYADENFFGTETEKTFTDEDMADADHYIFNGKEFVWVKEAGTLAAHKCWLEIAKDTGAAAPRRIVFVVDGEATGIAGVAVKVADAEGWYDLSGRKLNAVPTQKGIYIVNGKKVMVK